MKCGNCNNQNAWSMRFNVHGESCNECGDFRAKGSPDVYFRGPYLDQNLVDVNKPQTKDGTWISSKRQKRELMDKLNVVEKGDRKHGARNYDSILSRSQPDQFRYRF